MEKGGFESAFSPSLHPSPTVLWVYDLSSTHFASSYITRCYHMIHPPASAEASVVGAGLSLSLSLFLSLVALSLPLFFFLYAFLSIVRSLHTLLFFCCLTSFSVSFSELNIAGDSSLLLLLFSVVFSSLSHRLYLPVLGCSIARASFHTSEPRSDFLRTKCTHELHTHTQSTHVYIHIHIHTCTHIPINTQTYIAAHNHIQHHTHTHTYIYIQTYRAGSTLSFWIISLSFMLVSILLFPTSLTTGILCSPFEGLSTSKRHCS